MAHNREWDQGKAYWGGEAPQNTDYGDAKRRRTGFDAYEGYPDTSNYGQGQGVSRVDPFTGKKRLQPSEPSPHVIFLGLDPDFTESDLQAYLSSNGCSIETVTIIRDRSTGASKGFGFAQFSSTDHARTFVDPRFPFVQIPPPASHGAAAMATFYKALETGIPNNGRRVKIDFSQSASPHDRSRQPRGNTNDGTRDIGTSQAPVLLFRGLDPLSGPQAILQAMKSSAGPGKEGAKGMKRIILIKDKFTLSSFGFAFVEFVDIASSSAVLAAIMSPQIHPTGFRISDKPVSASWAHPYSFQQPEDLMIRDEACIPSSINLGGVEGSWVRYWDESTTVATLEFQVEQPAAATQQPSKEKKKKDKIKDAAQQAASAPSLLPISSKPVTLSFNKKATGATTTPAALGFNEVAEEPDDPALHEDPSKPHAVKKVAPLASNKKTANNISKWNQVQGALTASISAPTTAPVPAPVPVQHAPTETPESAAPLPVEVEFEFSDIKAFSCLLCSRQFKSLDQLKRHNKESDLHKKNFKDANLRDVARLKVAARAAAPKTEEQPKYRDRASERRTLFNQPDVPLPENVSKSAKRKFDEPPRPPSPAPPVNPGEDENNVGNKLLKMMGWTAGSGLGTEGDGRVEPIQTAIYAQGVGLGANKGKEIGKYADGYSGFVNMVQDAARERFEKS